MNVIRTHTGKKQHRILESFWESQLTSKQWIIDILKQQNIPCYGSVCVFGGWFGVLGGMLMDSYEELDRVYSIDIDENTKHIGEQLNPDVVFVVDDMKHFVYKETPTLIINTSTEHISQDVYDVWIQNVPRFVPIVLQGNNYDSIDEHVRCANSLYDFKNMNKLDSIIYEGELNCKEFTRYMTIGYRL